MPHFIERLSASASSHASLSLAAFVTNIAESDFRHAHHPPTPEIPCPVLDFISRGRHVATHNYMLQCNMEYFRCVIPAKLLPVFGRFESSSKVFLNRPERRRLALA